MDKNVLNQGPSKLIKKEMLFLLANKAMQGKWNTTVVHYAVLPEEQM